MKITTDFDFLRKVSKPVTDFDARLHQLLDDMRETMFDSSGIGIAAPQVGVLWRACIMLTLDGEILELVNPEIITQKRPKRGDEACLSIPERNVSVIRPQFTRIRAMDRFGNTFERDFKKVESICACHEIDHLNGVLITDIGEPIQ